MSEHDEHETPSETTAELRTVEQWAEQKGFLPQLREVKTIVGNRAAVAPRSNPLYPQFAAAKVANHWPEGKELTEAAFDAAIAEASSFPIR